jgi:hypothetical protein
VITLLVDANIDGHAQILNNRLQGEPWREFRDYLDIRFLHLADVGLTPSTKDSIVWRLCQERGFYLLTSNRNMEVDDSLEATIRREGTSSSLPVFTIADADRIKESPAYLDAVVNALLIYLLDEDNFRGTGRLFLPARLV